MVHAHAFLWNDSLGYWWLRLGYPSPDFCSTVAIVFAVCCSTWRTVYLVGGHIKQAGFSLIEIAVVLIIISLISFGGIGLVSALQKKKQFADTRNNLELVTAALQQHVTRAGRLPCPADGSLSPATGQEVRNGASVCTAQAKGVVPWVTLGLTESDVTDGWLLRFTYRVPAALVLDGSMNFSACDPAGSAAAVAGLCAAACNSAATCTPDSFVIVNKGFTVNNAAGVAQASPMAGTGAAFVVISHGEIGMGGYNFSGVFQAVTSAGGSNEVINANNQALQAFYVADNLDARDAPLHFDDFVIYKTVQSVVTQSRLNGRPHF